MNLEQLFEKIDFTLDFELTFNNILEFALVMSKIIDYRSRFTASHSYTVAQLASLIGECLGYDEIYCKHKKTNQHNSADGHSFHDVDNLDFM